MAIEDIRKLNVRSPYFVEVVDEYLGVVTPPPPPPPDPEPNGTDGFYYKLTRCSDLSVFYSISYPAEPFNSSERVEDSSGVSYVVSGSQEVEPAGVKKTITTTGLTGCPEVEIPESTTFNLSCGLQTAVPRTVGITKYKIDGSDREAGTFEYRITGVKTPIKYRAYTEGETPPAYVTIGLDSWAAQWLEATGEDASSLSPAGSYTDGVSTNDVVHVTSAAEAGKNVIVEIFSPITTISTMKMFTVSCPDVEAAPAPVDSGFVTVLTVESRGIFKGSSGQQAGTSDIMVRFNNIMYSMPNTNFSSGLRLILDDNNPNYAVSTNNSPYSGNSFADSNWSFDEGSTGKQMIPQEVNPTLVNSGANSLVVTANANVNFNMKITVMQHPVETVGGVKIIRHLGDSGTSQLRGIKSGFSLGQINQASSLESLTLRFSGVNEETLVAESSVYHHEVTINEGDSQERFDDVSNWFSVETIS